MTARGRAGETSASDTHLPSPPAPRPQQGSSPGAALPVGPRLRSVGPRRGRPRAPDRPRRTWRRRRLQLLLPPASPSLPARDRRARDPARPFSARRRRGSRGPGSGSRAGRERSSGPRARALGVGLGPCVRVSESVSHCRGLGIACEESKRRGRGSTTAGGHTGNGHGPRALACEGRGATLGTSSAVRHLGANTSAVRPKRWGPEPFVSLSEARSLWSREAVTQTQHVTASPRAGGRKRPGPAARTYDGGSRFAEARKSRCAAAVVWAGPGRGRGALRRLGPFSAAGSWSCGSSTAMREPSRRLSVSRNTETWR